ncbi:MAG: DUF2794 domain-containing protein [Rhodobacteraceae bacterium]|nr:DUF2794 domain-containing protein [Paracoccaceae bacterium]
MNNLTPFPGTNAHHVVAFHRTELSVILSLYGQMVAAGEWRDYGISSLKEVAVFSIFRRTAEQPLYRIEKRPKLRNQLHRNGVHLDARSFSHPSFPPKSLIVPKKLVVRHLQPKQSRGKLVSASMRGFQL